MKHYQSPHFDSVVSDLKALIESSLEDGKANDVVTIDLHGKTDVADYMIVASGTSQKHTSSLAQILIKNIKAKQAADVSVEGAEEGNWVLVDAGDIVVHLFKPETRDLYNLEKMWDAPLFAT
tara:strand:+ start:143 stop:508 length:366 start_codon:yes stop_codon:yes gene_type:complete